MEKETAAVLYSGGKDSTFACACALRMGYDVKRLITMVSANPDSYMLHTPNIFLTKLSSLALGIPQFIAHTAGNKEEELVDIKKAILDSRSEIPFDTLITGAIASVYQKERMEKIGVECGVKVVSPLWGLNQEKYLRNLAQNQYIFTITSVSADGLDRSWLGLEIGVKEIEKLILLSRKFGFNSAFEGGEAETLVLDCPIFVRGKIRITESKIVWKGDSGVLEVTKAELARK